MNMNTNRIKILLFALCFFFAFSFMTVYAANGAYVGENICGHDGVKTILQFAGYILIFAKVAVPLIIILVGTIDLFKVVIGHDESLLTKQLLTLGLRVAIGIFIFFIPTIVMFVIDLYYDSTDASANNHVCIDCVLSPKNCK